MKNEKMSKIHMQSNLNAIACSHIVYTLIITLLCLFSCRDKFSQSSNYLENTKVDTLLIDAKDGIIYTGDNFQFSDILYDSLIIFNLNSGLPAIEKISIGKRQLQKIIRLETEGPNGVGDWHIGFAIADDSLLVLEGDNAFHFLTLSGEFKEKVRIDHLFFAVDELVGKNTVGGVFVSGRRIYKIVKDDVTNKFDLLVYDVDDDSYQLFDIPNWQLVRSGSLIIEYPNGGKIISIKGYSINKFEDGIMVSNRTYPQIVFFKNDLNETEIINPPSRYYKDVEMVEDVPIFHSQDAANAYSAELEKRMHFLPPIWDERSNKILRWGFKRASGVGGDGDAAYDNFLFVIDSKFNMLREYHFPQIRIKPHKYFLENKKVYLYQNFQDEVGFIRVWLDNDN